MFLLRRLLATLDSTIGAGFQQGGAGEDLILHRLRSKLDALKTRTRRLARACAALFALFAAATIATAFVTLDLAVRATVASLLVGSLTVAAFGAVETLRVTTLIDALEELLSGGASLTPMDVVTVFRDRIQDEVSGTSSLAPLADTLANAYDSPGEARAILQKAGIPVGQINFALAMVPLWRDALRVAARREQLSALSSAVLSDPNVTAYHARVKALSLESAAATR